MIKTGATLYTRCLVFAMFAILIVLGCAAPKKVEEVATGLPKKGAAPSVVKVSKISTETLVGKMRITIDANAELTYTAFKLTDPLRLVLDLPGVDTTQVSEVTFTDLFPVMRITPFQFKEGDTVNSRIEVALSRLVPYQVFSDANKLFIDLETPVAEVAAVPSTPSLLPPGFEELKPAKEEHPVVIESTPEKMPSVSPKAPGLQAEVPTIEITKPPEIVGGVTSLPGVLAKPSAVSVIKDIAVSEVDGKTRITISADKTPEFDVKRSETPPRLTIDLKQSELLPGAEKVITPDDVETLVKQVRLFQLRRTPDGTDNVVRVLVDLMKPTKHEVKTEPEKLVLDIEHPAVVMAERPLKEGEKIVEVPLTTGIEEALKKEEKLVTEEIATAPAIRAPKTGEEEAYKGQLISIHFQDADIKEVLDVIAEVSGLNLIVHPGVSGKVTVRLENIPWDQALDIILKMNSLNVEIKGNIMRIAPANVFQQEIAQKVDQQRQQIEARRVQAELAPLITKLITVNFAEPGSIVSIIDQYFLGRAPAGQQVQRRGTITVDARTKTLIVQDTAENIKKIEEIVATLDRRTPQVLIEARIVTLDSTVRKELGINWSGSFSADPQHGNALDYRFPYTIDMPTFGVNLPSVGDPIGTTGPIRLGSIDDVISIFARIDAAEEDLKAKTLAQPKIFTQDNVAATVSSTQTQYIAVAGDAQTPASIQPVSAALSLNVTPRISSDGYITMIVSLSNGVVGTGPGGRPTTNDQTVNSQVTVKDSETVVIGGIFATTETKNFTAVPYLHKIPLLGWLFKSTNPHSQTQSELLVFLTPRILDRSLLKAEESSNVSLSY
jgi:type IV pilus secretin PilQ/predicted competence protein